MLRSYILLIVLLSLCSPVTADIYRYENAEGVIVYSDIPYEGSASLLSRSKQYASNSLNLVKGNFYKNVGKYFPIAKRLAEEYSVDPELIRAMITVESNWYPEAISSKGAMGLMQLMPMTAKSLSVSDPFDPEENISGGVRYFRMLLDMFKGDLRKSLAAYNAGPTRVMKKVNFSKNTETYKYVRKILALYGGEERFNYVPMKKDAISRPIFKIVLSDGTLLFTDTPLEFTDESF